jgi:cell wall assembly regulator SMI1
VNAEILAQIETWLSVHRPDYLSMLNPPAQDYLFQALQSTVGIALPENFKCFYKWHDGQEAGTFQPLFRNLTFMTLMEIATTHQVHEDVSIFDQWTDDHWQRSWVPFLSNGGGDYLCIATESFRDIPAGSVLWYDHEISDREIVHMSFEAFLDDLYDRMRTDDLDIG